MTGGPADRPFSHFDAVVLRGALTLALALFGCASPPAPTSSQAVQGRGAAGGPAGRCAALIALFDEIVLSRFDDRLLGLERDDLAEARADRDLARAECTAGRYGFGLPLAESALWQVGVVPPPDGN